MRIKKIYNHLFIGIPTELSVVFKDKKGKPVSTIILGDNGSGKSFVVDTIDYNDPMVY